MWYSENLGTFYRARPFEYEFTSYPATSFRVPDILASATIYPMRVEPVDNRYYIQGAETRTFANGVWVVSYEAVPKDLETLRKELVRYWLNRLDSTLDRTDKYLVRSDEMAQYFSKWAVNPALQAWRDDCYQLFNYKMNGITEAATFEGLVTADEQEINVPDQPVVYEIEE